MTGTAERAPLSDPAIGTLLVSAVLLTFTPVLVGSYGYTDDYDLLLAFSPAGDAGAATAVQQRFTGFGRPTMFPLIQFAYSHAASIADLRYLRAFAVLSIGLLACAVWRALVRAGWARGRSALAAL